jgi:biotin synthase
MELRNILEKKQLTKNELKELLLAKSREEIDLLRVSAYNTMKENVGEKVYLRGLIEFSNICINDCFYCGIRKSNKNLNRFILSKEEIINSSLWCAEKNYGSVVLQSGERNDEKFVDFVVDVVKEIKEKTKSEKLPEGLGITLCVGEQTYESYERFFDAGAHRYLLRIESSSPDIYYSLHPEKQNFEKRIECLKMLKNIGFQLGTGIMIGVPGQTLEHLVDDIMFFKELDIDMIGMGPYLVHKDTPMSHLKEEYEKNANEHYLLALKMIAVTRIFLKNVNIASTTALQAMKPMGREAGLRFGANVFMPLITPNQFRKDYQLYDGKPCIDEVAEDCEACSIHRISSIDREIGYNEWGDSKHFNNNMKVGI